MNRTAAWIGAGMALSFSALAQSPGDPNEGSSITRDSSNNTFELSWWGRLGQSYFVRHSEDLLNWSYYPQIVPGQGAKASIGIGTTASRYFLQLEIESDPFHTDSDGDGIPDGWEVLNGLNPHDPNDAFAMALGGLTYLQKFQQGLNPTMPDTDGDGVIDSLDGAPLDPDLNPSPVLEAKYAVIDLMQAGLIAGDSVTRVNNKAQVIGRNSSSNPTFWDQGLRSEIPMTWGNFWINNNGAVSGRALAETSPPYRNYAGRWAPGQSAATKLPEYKPTLSNGDQFYVDGGWDLGAGINDSGAIVGKSEGSIYHGDPDAPDYTRSYKCGTIWNGTAPAAVGDLWWTDESLPQNVCDPLAVSNTGVIAGSIYTFDPPFDAFVSEGNTVTRLSKLPTPPPYDSETQYPWASLINHDGTIIAGGMTSEHPVMWVKTATGWKAKNLGSYDKTTGLNAFIPGGIAGMNNRMEMVGYETSGGYPFLWQNGKVVDLNTRILPGWKVKYAYSINDNGMMTASVVPVDQGGNPTGAERPGLLLPVETITINTFIPQEWVDDPRNNPFQADTIFEGDNRSGGTPARATWNENGSHRTQHKFNIIAWKAADVDGLQDNAYANDPDGVQNDNQLVDIGTSRQYDKASSVNGAGHITPAARADNILGDTSLKLAEGTAPKSEVWIEPGWPKWLEDRKIEVKCRCEATNPLVFGAPAISYTFVITIDKTDPQHPTFSLSGYHDAFPAYEIYINHVKVQKYDPLVNGVGLEGLFPGNDVNVLLINNPLP